MRDQYKVLAEKYNVILEDKSFKDYFRDFLQKLLRAHTFEQAIELYKELQVSTYSVFSTPPSHWGEIYRDEMNKYCRGMGERLLSHKLQNTVELLAWVADEELVTGNRRNSPAELAKSKWENWKEISEPYVLMVRKAEEEMRKGSEEAGVNLDI